MKLLQIRDKYLSIYSLSVIRKSKYFKPALIGIGIIMLIVVGGQMKKIFDIGRHEEEIARITQEIDDYTMKINNLRMLKDIQLSEKDSILMYLSKVEKEEGLKVVSKNVLEGKEVIEGESFNTLDINVVYQGALEDFENLVYRLNEELVWVNIKAVKISGGNINAILTVYTK